MFKPNIVKYEDLISTKYRVKPKSIANINMNNINYLLHDKKTDWLQLKDLQIHSGNFHK